MEINSYNNSQPTFGAIKYGIVKNTLKEILSLKELQEFKSIVEKQSQNNMVDAVFYGTKKELCANVFDILPTTNPKSRLDQYSQRFYESPMRFIKRIVSKIEKRTPEVKEEMDKLNFEI